MWILNQSKNENQQIIDLTTEELEFLNTITLEPLYLQEHFTNASFFLNSYSDTKQILVKASSKKLTTKDDLV